jgi:hypothetical protein
MIDVRGKDMTLFGEVLRLPDNIIATIFDIGDESICHRHTIYHRHRVGGADAIEAKVTFNFTINQLAIVRADGVPAACVFDD